MPAHNPSLSQSQELETQLPYTDYFSKNVAALLLLRYTPDTTLDTYNGHFPFFHGTPIKMYRDGTSLVEDLAVIKSISNTSLTAKIWISISISSKL